jgi:hypothetical protein
VPVEWENFEAVEERKSPVAWDEFEPVEDKPRGASGTWDNIVSDPEVPAAVSEMFGLPQGQRLQIPRDPLPSTGEFLDTAMAPTGIATAGKFYTEAMTTTPEQLRERMMAGQELRGLSEQAGLIMPPEAPMTGSSKSTPLKAPTIPEGVIFDTALKNELAKSAEELTTGENQAIMLATMGAGAIPKVGAYLQRAVSGYFGVTGAQSVIEAANQLRTATTPEDKAQALSNIFKGAAIAAPAGLHAISPVKPHIQRAVERGADMGLNKSAAAALKAAERQPIEVETKVEPVEETTNTIQEQSPDPSLLRQERPEVGLQEVREPQAEAISRESARPQGSAEASLPLADRVAAMTAEEVANYAKETRANKSSPTAEAYALGRETTTPEQLAALKQHEAAAKAEFDAAMEAENVEALSPLAAKKQFFTEAIEEAVGAAQFKGKDLKQFNERMAAGEVAKPITPAEEAAPRSAPQPLPEGQAAVEQPGVGAVRENVPAPEQGELAAMGAATSGSFPTPPHPIVQLFQNLAKPLAKARAAASQLWQSRNVRDAMAFTRDAGENEAALFGRQAANEVRNAVKREFPKELAKAEDALTAVIEAGGSAEQLAANRAKLEASTAGDAKWRQRAMRAHDFALYNLDALKPIAEQYRALTDAQVTAEQGAGVDTLKRDNYVMHAQDLEDPTLFNRGGGGEPSGFKKNRTHATFADSISAGVDPKTINAVDLLDTRLRNGQRLMNSRAWVEGLRTMTDPKTGAPIAENPVTVTRADGSTYQQAPDGYKIEGLGRQPVAIQNGYEGIFTALTDPSQFSKNMAGRAFLTANGAGKSINLLFDTFHLGRLAFWESLIKGLGVKTFEAPLPSYRKGATLLDFSEAEIRKMAASGEVPKEWLPELVKNKQRLDTLVENGYNVGRVSDALYQDLIHHIPVVGYFNKWLFEKFQRGAMTEVGLLEFERRKNARPEESDATIARAVAKDLNTRFGNLGRQGVFKSKTAQDLARTIFLAPQWNEGLIRSELGAVKQAGEAVRDVAQGKRIYSGVLLRSVGAMALGQFTANQLINYYTRGHPTWENPEEGWGAKLSAWIPDKIGNGPGFFLHPLGLAAETTHLLMQKYEKTGDFSKVLNQYARSRSSAAMRPVLTFLTREDELGRKIKPDNIWGKIVNSAIPAPIGGSAIVQGAKEAVTKEPSESFPGQFQKQMMASVGVKTEQAPGAQSRIRTLASEFNKAKGIEPKAEFYEGDYVPLLKALQIGNQADAKEAFEALKKTKTPVQLRTYGKSIASRPFTGSKAREVEFRRGLAPEQQKAYQEALEERRRIQQEFFRLLRETN